MRGITFRQEVQESGIWNSHEHATDEWEGKDWPKHIREVLGKGTQKKQLTQEHALRGNRRGNVWFQLGKEVGFRMPHQREMKIGRIVGHCKGWLAVDVWISQGTATKSTRNRNGLPSWTKPEAPERITIQDTQAFPVSTTILCKDTREIYSVDDSSEWIDNWLKHIVSGPSYEGEQEVQTEQQTQAEEEDEKPWKYDTGKGPVEMSPEEPNSNTDTIWTVSDGGVREAGTHKARGGYGYIIKTLRESKGWGNFGYTMSGRGMVEGNNMYMDSTRAEARGLLATMIRLLASIKRYPNVQTIDHATDNEAVVDMYAGMKGRTTAEWLRATDTDIWYEIQQAEAKFATQGITYKVRWIRSHPEKRHTWLSDWKEDDVMNSMADILATLAMQEYVGMGNTELIQAKDSTRVWYVYTQEKGGKKMRITGKLRQMLKCHIQFRHYGTYLETSQASHIKGQNLHQVIDHSLLRKLWKPPVSCSKITHMVKLSKLLAGILATETVLTRRNQGTETNGKGTAVCKLCGLADETNLHMLCECNGNTELVTERRIWISKMRKIVKDTLSNHMNSAQLAVLMSLWNVDELGNISQWVSDDRLNLETPGTDPILLQLRVLIDKQKGVDNHMYGITTTEWREFLEESLDIPPSIALKFQTNLHRCTQHAIDNMWKERNFARHGKTSKSEIWEHRVFEAAIRSWKNEANRTGSDGRCRRKNQSITEETEAGIGA